MGTPLHPLGTRVAERLREAEEAQEAERRRVEQLTPSELISQRAAELSLQEKLAQQLGRALSRSLANTTWSRFQVSRWKVEVTPDFARCWYLVRIEDPDPWGESPPHTFTVTEETLALHTATVATFHDWMRAVADRMHVLFRRAPSSSADDEDKAQKRLAQHRQLVRRAGEELLVLGFQLHEQGVSEAEKQAAIESIKRALNGRRDS